MSRDEIRRANAEARLRKAEEQAAAGAVGRAAYDAEIAARDANMKRLKAERLAREAGQVQPDRRAPE